MKVLEVLETIAVSSTSICLLLNILRWYILINETRSGTKLPIMMKNKVFIISISAIVLTVTTYAIELAFKLKVVNSGGQMKANRYALISTDELSSVLILLGYFKVFSLSLKLQNELTREALTTPGPLQK